MRAAVSVCCCGLFVGHLVTVWNRGPSSAVSSRPAPFASLCSQNHCMACCCLSCSCPADEQPLLPDSVALGWWALRCVVGHCSCVTCTGHSLKYWHWGRLRRIAAAAALVQSVVVVFWGLVYIIFGALLHPAIVNCQHCPSSAAVAPHQMPVGCSCGRLLACRPAASPSVCLPAPSPPIMLAA